jgi:hypothetical protein
MTVITHMSMDQTTKKIWTCKANDDDLFIVGLTDDQTAGLVSGLTYMTAVGAPIIDFTIDVTGLDNVTFDVPSAKAVDEFFKSARALEGPRKVLAVRVESADGSNPYTEEQFVDNIFADAVNLSERFASCSYGKMTMVPYTGTFSTGVSITNGVYTVTISQATTKGTPGVDQYTLGSTVVNQLKINLGSNFQDLLDHYMIFLPNNMGSWGAYAYFPGKLSVYDGGQASFASAYHTHEIGHNLQMAHSSEGTDEYGDGKSPPYRRLGFPKNCWSIGTNLIWDPLLLVLAVRQIPAAWGTVLTMTTLRFASIRPRAGSWAGTRTDTPR